VHDEKRVRLQRYLSQAGVAARRKAERLIVEGRVKVNGHVVRELGTTVDPDADRVQVDGEAVHPAELFYAVLNKPKGSITSVSDPEGRRTVMEYLPNVPVTIAPVGRLDFYSEGVLLLTNDGELSAALQSSKTHAEKTYHVKFRGLVRRTTSRRCGAASGSKTAPGPVRPRSTGFARRAATSG
jgi:23S rRNA pseudouridine2605 synthase